MTAPRILLLGATGAFGSRLAEGLVRSGLGVLAVARGLADGSLAFRGAAPCVGVLDYDRIAEGFAAHRITTRIEARDRPAPLFMRLLGAAASSLPPAIRAGHDVPPFLVLEAVGARAFGVTLPRLLTPVSAARELSAICRARVGEPSTCACMVPDRWL